MSKKSIQLNNLNDIYKALEQDLITPIQAIAITCKALKMIDLRFNDKPLIKKEVLQQIQNLDRLINEYGDVPIFFGQQSGDF